MPVPVAASTLGASALRRRMSPLALLTGPLLFACFAGGCSGSTDDLSGPSDQTDGTGGTILTGGAAGSGSTAGAAGDEPGGAAGSPGIGGQATGGSGGTTGTGGSTQTGGSSGGGTGGGSGGGGSTCYREDYHPTADLSDLRSAYAPQHWLDTMLDTLERRHPDGFSLMDQMKADPWLQQDFPTYFEMSDWEGMIFAVDTACHEETHGWDYERALSTPGRHAFYLRANLTLTAPKLSFFPRNELLSYAQQGGSVTAFYDDYLTGEQGTYDFVALADELNAYINGLACATSVGDQFDDEYMVSYRDGVAAHVLFLLFYIKHARTSYPSLYAQWKADADWQKFVRFSWARAHYWTDESMTYAFYGIDDAPIWARINQQDNRLEMENFTGQSPDAVACTP